LDAGFELLSDLPDGLDSECQPDSDVILDLISTILGMGRSSLAALASSRRLLSFAEIGRAHV